jgi:uncharacterized membrane protein affecting hemolysin expression
LDNRAAKAAGGKSFTIQRKAEVLLVVVLLLAKMQKVCSWCKDFMRLRLDVLQVGPLAFSRFPWFRL